MIRQFDLELPISLAYKVEKIMAENHCTVDEAFFLLVERVCTP